MGKLAVRLHDRVDIRRVQDGDTLRHPLAGREHEQSVSSRHGQALLTYARERWQEDVLSEPLHIVRMTRQDRAVRGGPPDASGADLLADKAVQQRGLACAG